MLSIDSRDLYWQYKHGRVLATRSSNKRIRVHATYHCRIIGFTIHTIPMKHHILQLYLQAPATLLTSLSYLGYTKLGACSA